MKGRKNDFSMSFYNSENKRVLFLEYVHDTCTAVKWVGQKIPFCAYYRLYERRTRKPLGKYSFKDCHAVNPL